MNTLNMHFTAMNALVCYLILAIMLNVSISVANIQQVLIVFFIIKMGEIVELTQNV